MSNPARRYQVQFEVATQALEAGDSHSAQGLAAANGQLQKSPVRRAPHRGQRASIDQQSNIVQLQISVDRTLTDLTRAAVIQSVRAGYDEARIFRVSRLARDFAEAHGMAARRLRSLQLAMKLMDVGNMAVSDRLLRKACELTPAERLMIDEHAALATELLVRTRLALLLPCIPIVRFHHDRWDGTGPNRVAGLSIPLEARVASLADVFDALTHARPWRPALTPDEALRILESESGSRFDPKLCRLFICWAKEQLVCHAGFDAYFGAEAADTSFMQARRRIRQIAESSVR
jgi:putative two-component system response regulator